MQTLLAELEKYGIKLSAEGDKIRFTAPAGALTPELRSRLAAGKAEIIAYLRSAPRLHPEQAARS